MLLIFTIVFDNWANHKGHAIKLRLLFTVTHINGSYTLVHFLYDTVLRLLEHQTIVFPDIMLPPKINIVLDLDRKCLGTNHFLII